MCGQERRGIMREREQEEDQREHGRARVDQREEDMDMPLVDDDEDELAAFRAADAARGAMRVEQREGGAIENFVQGSQVTLLIASTQNAGIFDTDGGRREDVFNMIAEARPAPQLPCLPRHVSGP